MKAIKYLVAAALMMGLSMPAMAQDVNYKDMLKSIEANIKSGNATSKDFDKSLKEYQKEFKKDPKALVALGNILAINKQYDKAMAVADAITMKFKNFGDAYILKGDIYALQDNGGVLLQATTTVSSWILRILRDTSAMPMYIRRLTL